MAATTQHRIQVTETPPLAHALDVARQAWPDEKRTSRLIERLAIEGAERLDAAEKRRRDALEKLIGSQPGVYPEGYLDALRAEWPA